MLGKKKALQDKIALVTGASRGIGAAVALAYAKEGAQVIISGRSVGGLEETDDKIKEIGGTSTIVPFDILDYAKIDELGYAINERFGRLDILVGNAGMLGGLSPITHYTPEIWQKVIDTNLTANWRLLRSVDPLLRMSEAGRAMFVTSYVGRNIFPYWGPYSVSKLALECMVKTYASEVEKSAIRANLIEPGIVATKMRQEAMPGEKQDKLKKPEQITPIFVQLADSKLKENGKVFNIEGQVVA